MVQTNSISVKIRQQRGSNAARRLRGEGIIPAVIYGHKQETLSVTVSGEAVIELLRHGAHGLLELDVEGTKESAVIKDLQWDVFGREVLHVDFARVSKDELVTLEVPIVLRGTAPGLSEGGVLDQPLHSLEISCRADNIQESLIVNLNALHLGQAILVKDLKLNEGAKLLAEPDQIVVQIVKPTEEKETEEPTEEASGTEPELIRREAKTDEEEE